MRLSQRQDVQTLLSRTLGFQTPLSRTQFSQPPCHVCWILRPPGANTGHRAGTCTSLVFHRSQTLLSQTRFLNRRSHLRKRCQSSRVDDKNSGPLVQRRLPRFTFTPLQTSSVWLPRAWRRRRSFLPWTSNAHFSPLFLFPTLRRPHPAMQSAMHQVLTPFVLLGVLLAPARQFGVGFHSNRHLLPQSGPLPSLRGQSSGAQSLCIAGHTPSSFRVASRPKDQKKPSPLLPTHHPLLSYLVHNYLII